MGWCGGTEVEEGIYRESWSRGGIESTRESRWLRSARVSGSVFSILHSFGFNSFWRQNTLHYDARADIMFGFLLCIWWNGFWNIKGMMVC